MAQRKRADITAIVIAQINTYAEERKWFWVAGLARECWQGLLPSLAQLHPVAQRAVEHYAEEQAA